MKRFILTGAPGAGKTAVLRQLELNGFSVVEEAATDVIALEQARGVAEPWRCPSFCDSIVALQKTRQVRAANEIAEFQFHDRSVVCTAALATYLGYAFSKVLLEELERIRRERSFERRVFFLENLGFVTPSAARRISFEESLRFERIHEEMYRMQGFEVFMIRRGSISERAAAIVDAITLRID